MRTLLAFLIPFLVTGCTDKVEQKQFTSNNNWFTLTYPSYWTVFDEEDGTYLFMDNDDWKGNLRVSSIRLQTDNENSKKEFLQNRLDDELKENVNAEALQLGEKEGVYYVKDIEQEGEKLEVHYWITGDKGTLLICSFTLDKDKANNQNFKNELLLAKQTVESIKII